jgi:hypothetical protein
MPDADLVVVHAFDHGAEAEVAKSALDAAGIDSMIQADSGGGMRPHLAWAGVGFRILVRSEDLAAARDVLNLPAKQI